MDIEPVTGNPQVAVCRHCYGGKGLVDLEQVHVADRPVDLLEQLADRRDRCRREPDGVLAMRGVRFEFRRIGRWFRSATERRVRIKAAAPSALADELAA